MDINMVTIHRARSKVQEIKQVLSETRIDTYGSVLSKDRIHKVTTIWHNPELLTSQIQNPKVFFGVAKDEGNTILGHVTARRQGDDALVINRLFVSPQYQRKGIGDKLLEESRVAFPDM